MPLFFNPINDIKSYFNIKCYIRAEKCIDYVIVKSINSTKLSPFLNFLTTYLPKDFILIIGSNT